MSNHVTVERDALMETISDMLGDTIQSVTVDAATARPSPNKIAILIEPPRLEYPDWTNEPVITWTLDIMAGTMATQAAALDLITDAIETMAAKGLNIQDAQPATFNLAGAGTIAAYQVTLNPLELTTQGE